MQIKIPDDSATVERTADEGLDKVSLRVAFHEYSNVNTQIQDIRLEDIRVCNSDTTLLARSDVEVRGAYHEKRRIGDRPLVWRNDPDTEDTNTFVLVFFMRPISDRELTRPIRVRLRIEFKNFVTVLYDILLQWSENRDTLKYKDSSRTYDESRIARRLFFLIVIAILLAIWNWFFNSDIHRQSSTFSQQFISLGLGAVASFFLLSPKYLKQLFGNLKNLSSACEFPELHFDSRICDYLRLKRSAWLLAAALLLCLAVVAWHWSVPMPNLQRQGLVAWDEETHEEVVAKRVYLRHLLTQPFSIVCSEGGPAETRMKLARLSIGSWPWNLLSPFRKPRLIEEHFELNYPAYMNKARSRGTGKEMHRELVRGIKLVSLELERGGVGVRSRACGTGEDEEYTYVRYRSEIGERTLDGQRVAAVFEIRSRPVVEYADLDDERGVFQIEVLATQRLGDLYSNRQDLVQDFVDSLSDRVGVVSKTGALRLIREILENIVEPEEGVLDVASSLEAAIIVQTLVGELARRGSEAMREGDVESLIEAFEDKFADVSFEENDYRALRSHWEWLLVLEKHYPDTVGPKAHLAIVREAGEEGGDSASWLEREGPEAVLQYLKASVRVGRFLMQQSELPERKAYFKRAVSDVVKLRDFQNKVESVVRQAPDKVDTGPLRAFILSSIEAGPSTAAPGRALEGL